MYSKKNGKENFMKMVQVKRLLVIPNFWGHGVHE